MPPDSADLCACNICWLSQGTISNPSYISIEHVFVCPWGPRRGGGGGGGGSRRACRTLPNSSLCVWAWVIVQLGPPKGSDQHGHMFSDWWEAAKRDDCILLCDNCHSVAALPPLAYAQELGQTWHPCCPGPWSSLSPESVRQQ